MPIRVLRVIPRYAPAWARLGRVHRVIAKYGYGDSSEEYRLAEEAFRTGLVGRLATSEQEASDQRGGPAEQQSIEHGSLLRQKFRDAGRAA